MGRYLGDGDIAVRNWQQETFEEFWVAVKDKTSPDLLKFLDPRQELYFRLDNVHVALETYRGLSGVFVNASLGDGRAFWVRELHDWLAVKDFKRLYFAAETMTWGRLLMARYARRGMTMEAIEGRPGWGMYYIKIQKEA